MKRGTMFLIGAFTFLSTVSMGASHYIDVPYHPQALPMNCAPACMEMLFDYWGADVAQNEIGMVMNTNQTTGTLPLDIRRGGHFSNDPASVDIQTSTLTSYTKRANGYAAYEIFTPVLSEIKDMVDQDVPVMVFTNITFPPIGYSGADPQQTEIGHARVVIGYDDSDPAAPNGTVILHDPHIGPDIKFDQVDFETKVIKMPGPDPNGCIVQPLGLSVAFEPSGDVLPGTSVSMYVTGTFPCAWAPMVGDAGKTLSAQGISISEPASWSLDSVSWYLASPMALPGSQGTVTFWLTAPDQDGTYEIPLTVEGYVHDVSESYSSGYRDFLTTEATASIRVAAGATSTSTGTGGDAIPCTCSTPQASPMIFGLAILSLMKKQSVL